MKYEVSSWPHKMALQEQLDARVGMRLAFDTFRTMFFWGGDF